MKILVTDDSKTNLSMITRVLTKLGHTVLTANNGMEAIEIFQQEHPDLIILDVVMEGINGFETARRIRRIDSINWIPIVFLSGTVDDINIAKGIDAGGDDYLTKPCSDITLAAKIKAMQRIADMRKNLFEATQRLYLLSSTDPLTGIYNRLQFDRSLPEILTIADRFNHQIALMFLDLDNFKYINDSFGHKIGDLLLIEVAKRLKSCIRASDFLARLGGDEFTIILNEVKDPRAVLRVAQNIIDTFAVDYNIENHSFKICVSIGIAYYPDEHVTKDSLLLSADIAMYHAKASGRNNFKVFSKDLYKKYKRQLDLEQALKFALEKNELFLTYQPRFNLQTKLITGLETTLIWDNPKFDMKSPRLFLRLAEEAGIITDIGNWLLSVACSQAVKWPLHKIKDFKFTINISPLQMLQDNFYNHVVDVLKKTNLPPQIIQFELIESAIMSYDEEILKDTIKILHELGINIAIGDFGSGYSSLIRLNKLPIDSLKIEKTLIQDSVNSSSAATIVSYIIAIGKSLKINVVADGIENKKQLEFLIKKDCPEGQGSFLCKPLAAAEVSDYIENAIKTPSKSMT